MFDYTKAALQKIQDDFNRFIYRFSFASQILYIVYLLYMIFAPAGILWANIALLTISVAYFVIFLIATVDKLSKRMKKLKKISQNIHTRTKLLIKLFTLGVNLYGIYAATANVTPFSIILTTLSILAWVLQALFHVIKIYIVDRFNLLLTGAKADIEPIERVIKKITRKPIEEQTEKSKHRLLLDKKVEQSRAERAQAKLQEKLDKKQAKVQARLDKKQEKAQARAEKHAKKEKNRDN